MKKVILSIFAIFMVLSLSIVLVKASETTSVTIEGVKIRIDGNNGLKWVANVENHVIGNEYGFLFAQGDLAEVTIDTANVVNKVVEGVIEEINNGVLTIKTEDSTITVENTDARANDRGRNITIEYENEVLNKRC